MLRWLLKGPGHCNIFQHERSRQDFGGVARVHPATSHSDLPFRHCRCLTHNTHLHWHPLHTLNPKAETKPWKPPCPNHAILDPLDRARTVFRPVNSDLPPQQCDHLGENFAIFCLITMTTNHNVVVSPSIAKQVLTDQSSRVSMEPLVNHVMASVWENGDVTRNMDHEVVWGSYMEEF